eukprot:5887014-Prorocentrum_lima.AAC.1
MYHQDPLLVKSTPDDIVPVWCFPDEATLDWLQSGVLVGAERRRTCKPRRVCDGVVDGTSAID